MPLSSLLLRDGNRIPLLAFGTGTTWFKDPDKAGDFDPAVVAIVKDALAAGFRHLDCAEMYGNEKEVGIAIRESGIAREDLYITTKVSEDMQNIEDSLEQSLADLQLSYVDLYLIHEPWCLHCDEDYQQAWAAMERVKANGKTRSIGISDFAREDLEILLRGGIHDLPAVNQIEYHAHLQRENDGVPYIPWLQQQGIQVEAFKGLSPLLRCPDSPLLQPLADIAKAHSTTGVVVLLRWLIQQQVVAVTTTRSRERLKEYLTVFDMELSDAEMQTIFEIGRRYWKRFYFPGRYAEDDHS